jgi:hypothetical protein
MVTMGATLGALTRSTEAAGSAQPWGSGAAAAPRLQLSLPTLYTSATGRSSAFTVTRNSSVAPGRARQAARTEVCALAPSLLTRSV